VRPTKINKPLDVGDNMRQELHDLRLMNSLDVTFEGIHCQVLCSRRMRAGEEIVHNRIYKTELTRCQSLLVRVLDLLQESGESLRMGLAGQFLGTKPDDEYSS
jgi:hypothetical protein